MGGKSKATSFLTRRSQPSRRIRGALLPKPTVAKKEQREVLEAEGFQTETVLASGPAAIEVNRVARKQQTSPIVVGTHGATLAREMLIGGTAMGLVHHATLPVLVIRLKFAEDSESVRCVTACRNLHWHVLLDVPDVPLFAHPGLRPTTRCGILVFRLLAASPGPGNRGVAQSG